MSSRQVVPETFLAEDAKKGETGGKNGCWQRSHKEVCGDCWEAGFVREGDTKWQRISLQIANVLLIILSITVIILTLFNVLDKFAAEKISPTTKVSINDFLSKGTGLEFPQVVVCWLPTEDIPAGASSTATWEEATDIVRDGGGYISDIGTDGNEEEYCSNGGYTWGPASCVYTAGPGGKGVDTQSESECGYKVDILESDPYFSCVIYNPSFEYDVENDMKKGKSTKGTSVSKKGAQNNFQDLTMPLKAFRAGSTNSMRISLAMQPNIIDPDSDGVSKYGDYQTEGGSYCFSSVNAFKNSLDANGADIGSDSVASMAKIAFFQQGHVLEFEDLFDLSIGLNPNFQMNVALETSTVKLLNKEKESNYAVSLFTSPLWISQDTVMWEIELTFGVLAVTDVEQVIAYDEISALSELGGISGLMLGWKLSSVLVWMKWLCALHD